MTNYDIIIAPILSEKSYDGIPNKKYTFKVAVGATKGQIKDAVEKIFGVKVEKVKELLRETGRPLGVIAVMCGFKSCDDMRRTFRQFTGCSLSVWRRKQNEKGMTK